MASRKGSETKWFSLSSQGRKERQEILPQGYDVMVTSSLGHMTASNVLLNNFPLEIPITHVTNVPIL